MTCFIYNQDSRDLDKRVEGESVACTITSPPYFDMKDYGNDRQIGYGQNYEEYLNDLKSVFSKVYDATKLDGTLWVIIDTFKEDGRVIPLPFDLSQKISECGWRLQDIIIWKKDKTVPWSGNGFVQRKFEYVLLFSKSRSFKYYKDRVKVYDTRQLKKWWIKYPERYNPRGKALDEVWEYPIPTQGSWGDKYIKHFCPLPADMIATIIQLATDEGDVVLDPFAGTGSVLAQASFMRRKYIGFELNSEYIEMFNRYLFENYKYRIKAYDALVADTSGQDSFEDIIINLRSLKFARVLLKKIKNEGFGDGKILVERTGRSNFKNKIEKVRYVVFSEVPEAELRFMLDKESGKAPLSKFGIEPLFEILSKSELHKYNDVYCFYTEKNTNQGIGDLKFEEGLSKASIFSKIHIDLDERDYE
tara:strand:+ start:1174 stop:2424 length:1251 start_codon:yes stop_codon:yes gene_type:complete